MPFKFLMYAEGGEGMGDNESAVPSWVPGDTLYIGGEAKYRILAVLPNDEFDNDSYNGIWAVAPLETAVRAIPDPM